MLSRNPTGTNPTASRSPASRHIGNSQHRPTAHALVQEAIRRSRPADYRLPTDGRKWRVQCLRRQRLAVYLTGYRDCFPGLNRIARELEWSRRTVCVVMAELKQIGVMKPMGYVAEHGTRRRVLNPKALRQSCTPGRRQSCTQELPGKVQRVKRIEDDGPRAGARAPVCPRPQLNQAQIEAKALHCLTGKYQDRTYALALMRWTKIRHAAGGADPIVSFMYYVKSAENFHLQRDDATQQALLEEAIDYNDADLRRAQRRGRRKRMVLASLVRGDA